MVRCSPSRIASRIVRWTVSPTSSAGLWMPSAPCRLGRLGVAQRDRDVLHGAVRVAHGQDDRLAGVLAQVDERRPGLAGRIGEPGKRLAVDGQDERRPIVVRAPCRAACR